ncbi:MAG: hypothetical protein IPK32_17715 [Verrucomicrobiaceae bacterium]|nr:hypothetical protein [Verrucomicrobiaceae bacterium]
MKKILTLLIVLAGILAIAYYQSNERNSRLNRSTGSAKHRELLIEELDINGIKKLHLKEDKKETTIEVKGDRWVVAERGGYPANKEKLQEQLMSLRFEKVKAARRVGKDSWGKIGVNSPGDATAYGVGTLVELHDDTGGVKHSMVLGGKVNSSGGSNDQMAMFGGGPTGNRFIRLKDDTNIYEVANQYEGLANDPAAWLLKDFVNVANIQSLEVIAAKPEDSWKVSKKAESDADFTLEGAKAGESLDNGKASVASFLSAPQFDDVQPKEKAAETMKDSVKAVITTFDGFTYTIQAAKKAVDGADKYFMIVTTTAKIADKRPAVKDEKEEDKKKADEAFAKTKKELEDKLAKEKGFDGWVYQVSEYTINTIFKKRSEILTEKKDESPKEPTQPVIPGLTPGTIPGLMPSSSAPPPAAPTSSVPPPASATSAPITVTTPPVSATSAANVIKDKAPLPEAPKVELKPAPAPTSPPAAEAKK